MSVVLHLTIYEQCQGGGGAGGGGGGGGGGEQSFRRACPVSPEPMLFAFVSGSLQAKANFIFKEINM